MGGHIDKLAKCIEFDIATKPVGAVHWDFLCEMEEAETSLLRNYNLGPEAVFFYPTSICNAGCLNCTLKNSSAEPEVKLEVFKEFVRREKQKRLKYVVLDGDASSASVRKELGSFLSDEKLTWSLNFCSSVDRKFLESISSTVAKLQCRMQSLDSTPYNEQLIQVLEDCRQLGIYTAVIFSLTKKTARQLREMIAFCERYGVKQFSFLRLPFCPFAKENISDLSPDEYLAVSRELLEYRQNNTNLHITSNDALWKGCGAWSSTCTILPNGLVYPCAYLPIAAGSLINDDWNSIWNKDELAPMRQGRFKGKCGRCKYVFHCKGCRAYGYAVTNDWQSEDGGCWLSI